MATFLPLELETQILLRLPAKSLQRFTSVCKSWHSLINHPSFISMYYDFSKSQRHQLLLLRHPFNHFTGTTSPRFSLSSDITNDGPTTTTKLPLFPINSTESTQLKPRRVELLTSHPVNGILCVAVYMGLPNGPEAQCGVFFWNPSTGERLKLPDVSDVSGPALTSHSGFGYDVAGEDYKVVRVVYVDSVNVTAEVYSLRENSWRGLVFSPLLSGILSNILWASSVCTYLNGWGHWGAYKKERKDGFFILGFDFSGERFRKIKLPVECVDGRELRYHGLWVYKESLALSVLRFGEFESRVTRHYIWVMIKDWRSCSWVKVFDIDLEGGPRKPVACLRTGEVVLLGEGNGGDHVLYNPEEEEVKCLDLFDVDAVVPYVESLCCLSRLLPGSASSEM